MGGSPVPATPDPKQDPRPSGEPGILTDDEELRIDRELQRRGVVANPDPGGRADPGDTR